MASIAQTLRVACMIALAIGHADAASPSCGARMRAVAAEVARHGTFDCSAPGVVGWHNVETLEFAGGKIVIKTYATYADGTSGVETSSAYLRDLDRVGVYPVQTICPYRQQVLVTCRSRECATMTESAAATQGSSTYVSFGIAITDYASAEHISAELKRLLLDRCAL